MDSEAIKASRRILRSIQNHLYHAHINLGGIEESVGLVDVLHHPTSTLASLNYATPRRNTAWVSADMIQQGIDHMRQINRTPRVQYIEGLFPPLFSKTLIELGLRAEWELPLMAYISTGFNGITPTPIQAPVLPEGIRIESVNDQRGIELWWYVWRNAFYDVMTLGVEPLFVGRDMAALKMGHQIDILAYRGGFPIGVGRVSIHEKTAHILALALMKEERTPEMTRILQSAAMKAALDRNCTLIYAPGETEGDRRLCREMGFLDFGSIVRYSSNPLEIGEEKDDHILGQPVLALR
jgi:hypothetical protein